VRFENEDQQAELWKELATVVAEDLKLTLDSLSESERWGSCSHHAVKQQC